MVSRTRPWFASHIPITDESCFVSPSDAELLGYADESLGPKRAAEVEAALRDSAKLRARAAELLRDRDDGVHTLADIWRRNRVGCPGRSVLGSYLLGLLEAAEHQTLSIHINDVGCRYCRADVDDLINSREDAGQAERQRRFFASSIGLTRE